MERGEARSAQTAGLKGFDQGGSLFGGIAEPAAAVGFQDGVIGSSHNPPRYDCYATLRPESSDGGGLRLRVENQLEVTNETRAILGEQEFG
jgi:hypothetical protein